MADTKRFTATHELDRVLRRRERSRSWLARKVGVSTSLMWFVVRGERTLSEEKALRIAAVLDEDIANLFVSTPQIIFDAVEAVA